MIAKTLRAVDRIFEWAIVGIFALMVIAGGMQVFNRFVLNQSLSWSEEFQRYAHVWIVYLTIPVAYRRGLHIGMEMLRDKLPSAVRTVLRFLTHVLWIVLGSSIIIFSQKIMRVAVRQRSPGMGLPMNYVYLGLVIGASYLLLVALRKLFGELRVAFQKREG